MAPPRLIPVLLVAAASLTGLRGAPPDSATVYAWYAGDEGLSVRADNYSVNLWVNRGTQATNSTSTQASRNLVNLTGAPQKVYLRQPGGSPAGAVRFSGTDGIWATKTAFGILSGERTVIACARVQDGFPQGFLFDSTSMTPGYMRAMVWSNWWRVSSSSGSGSTTVPVVTNEWQVHAFVVSTNSGAPQFRHYVNGQQAATIDPEQAGNLSGLMIGANVAQQFGIRADVAEFMVFNSALEDSTRIGIESYLTNKWFAVVADTNAPQPPVAVQKVPVFVNGQDGYGCYRIPAMVTTLKGTVIAMADGRISGCGDIPNPLDLVIKRSFDNGRTWGPLQVVANYGTDPNDTDVYPYYGITNPIPRVCAGDAALLLDRANGRVWALYDNGGTTGSRKIKLEMRYSDDDGATWSDRLDIEALNPGLRPAGGEFLAGPGNGIQLEFGPHAGRLVFPVYIYGNPSSSLVIYSDDHGVTWQRGGVAGAGGGEIQVAETAGGGLLASMRDNNFATTGVRTFSRSTDGGLTWFAIYTSTTNQAALPDPACQGSILRLTTTNDSNRSRLVFANAADSSSRINMTLRVSFDEGATWPVTDVIYAGSSAYSALTRLASAEVGLLFETDNYTRIDFVRRSVPEMSGGADALPPYAAWAGSVFTPAQLMDPAVSGPEADPDGDGASNHSEFIAGTRPLDRSSALRLKLSSPSGQAMLSFEALSNRSYTLQSTTLLGVAEWQREADFPPGETNFIARVPVQTTIGNRFFRLVTPQLEP